MIELGEFLCPDHRPIFLSGVLLEHLDLSLFGSFDARLDGKSIAGFESDKVRALLAYLAVESDQAHRRQKLAGLLWPDWPEQNARTNLRNALSNLRKVIRDAENPFPHLVIDPEQLRFNLQSSARVDVLEFIRLTEKPEASLSDLEMAGNCQTRPFLEGFSLEGCAEFESWMLITQQNLRQRLLIILSQLCRQYELRGELGCAIEVARRQISLEPFEEPFQRDLLRLLALNGERSAALAQYEAFRKTLRIELGIEPEQETSQLIETILASKLQPIKKKLSTLHDLPVYLTRFFGRQEEIHFVCGKLSEERLVTLTGSGGVGKTRLAVMAAEVAVKYFPDGIWFIPLATLSDPGLVVQQVASLLGIFTESKEPTLEMVSGYLRPRSALLVIDNCEHLLDQTAWVVERLLSDCPKLVVLATSRQPLGLFGETILRVPSLPIPPQDEDFAVQDISTFASVHLFVDRARQVKPDFVLEERNFASVTQICQRLGGIPLALELAAVRLNMLSVEELAARLDQVFSLLTGGSRTALPRHQTLRATLDWSYHLLSEKEARLMRRLAVFAGDWSLAGAEDVCPGEGIEALEVPGLLSGLVDKSLVEVIQAPGQQTRYRMLEMIRQYAHEELEKSGEVELHQHRHLAYFIKLVEENDPKSHGQQQLEWMLSMEADIENFRKALTFGLEADPRSGLRLACALANFWGRREISFEGARWLQAFLRKPENRLRDPLRALGLIYLCFRLPGELDSERWAQESMAIFQELNDIPGLARAYLARGVCLVRHEDFIKARPPLEKAREIFEELHDLPNLARVTNLLSWTYKFTGPISKSISLRQAGLALDRELADPHEIALACEYLADIMMCAGELNRAMALCEEADANLRQVEPSGYRHGVAYAIAEIACWLGDYGAVWGFLEGVMKKGRYIETSSGSIAYQKFYQGYFLCLLGQTQEGKQYLEEGLSILKASRIFSSDLSYQQTYLQELARASCSLGETSQARQLIEEYRHLFRLVHYQPGFRGLLGFLHLVDGQGSLAFEHYQESLRFAHQLGFRLQALLALEGCAWALVTTGQATRAASLLGAAGEFREKSGAVVFPRDRPVQEKTIALLKSSLGEKGYDTAWREGYQSGFDQTIQDVLA